MAKPNYQYEKRQRELEKKRKKEEKAQRRTVGGPENDGTAAQDAPEPGQPAAAPGEVPAD